MFLITLIFVIFVSMCVCVCVCVCTHPRTCTQSLSGDVLLFDTPGTIDRKAPLFMGFPREEYWSFEWFILLIAHLPQLDYKLYINIEFVSIVLGYVPLA